MNKLLLQSRRINVRSPISLAPCRVRDWAGNRLSGGIEGVDHQVPFSVDPLTPDNKATAND